MAPLDTSFPGVSTQDQVAMKNVNGTAIAPTDGTKTKQARRAVTRRAKARKNAKNKNWRLPDRLSAAAKADPIVQLGLQIARLEFACERYEKEIEAISSSGDKDKLWLKKLDESRMALARDEIYQLARLLHTRPAQSLAGAAIQADIALTLLKEMEAKEMPNDVRDCLLPLRCVLNSIDNVIGGKRLWAGRLTPSWASSGSWPFPYHRNGRVSVD